MKDKLKDELKNKMKDRLSLHHSILCAVLLTLIMTTIMATFASAESAKANTNIITPKSGILWEIKKIGETIQLILAFKPEQKASVGMQIAEQRIRETKTLISEERYELINKSAKDFERVMAKINSEITSISKADLAEELKVHLILENNADTLENSLFDTNNITLQQSAYLAVYSQRISSLKEIIENRKMKFESSIMLAENLTEEQVEEYEAEFLLEAELKKSGSAGIIEVAERKFSALQELVNSTSCTAVATNVDEIEILINKEKYYETTNLTYARELAKQALKDILNPKFKKLCRCEEFVPEVESAPQEAAATAEVAATPGTTGEASLTIVKQKKKCRIKLK